MTNEELSTMSMSGVIRKLYECEDLTVRELRSLPAIGDAVPADNPYMIERTIARLTVAEIDRILAMARRYLVPAPSASVTGYVPPTVLTTTQLPGYPAPSNDKIWRGKSNDNVQVKLPQIGE